MEHRTAGSPATGAKDGAGGRVPRGEEILAPLLALLPGIAFIREEGTGRISLVNDGIQRILGFSDEEVAGMGERVLDTLLHPDDRATEEPKRIVRSSGPDGVEASSGNPLRLRTRAADWKWFEPRETRSPRAGTEEGSATLELWIDVTDRHRAQEENRIVQDRLALATMAARIGLWDWEVQNDVPLWDASMYELYGIARGKHPSAWAAWRSAVHPDDQESVLKQLHAAMAGRVEYHPEFRIVRPDGSIRIVQSRAHAVRDASGGIVRMAGVSIDITELRDAEIAIRKSSERLHFALESSRIGAWDLDVGNRTAYRSLEHARIFGYDSANGEWGFESFLEHVLPEERDAVRARLARTIETGAALEFECRIRRRDGEVRWIWVAGRISREREGETGVVVGLVQDIQERKLATEELERYRGRLEDLVEERTSQLQAANRELDAFCHTVSHDLRAPLRHMDGFVDLLVAEHGPALPEEGRRFVEIISNSARRMGSLIDDLLRFSRTTRQDMATERVDMRSMVEELVHGIQENGRDEDRPVEFRVGELAEVDGDGRLLRQVWANLLDNAVKYSGREPKPTIEVGSEGHEGEVVFFVRDNGVGFDMTYAKKLFGVFQRLHRSDEFEGTGIGLATVDRIVARHGGRVWADSAPGKGSTFWFSLPGVLLKPS